MAMIETPQRIDMLYRSRQHWFEVWRYETMPDLHAALLRDGIRDFTKDTVAYTDCYTFADKGEECGRIYLLDKSVATLTTAASKMAFNVARRAGILESEAEWQDTINWQDEVSKITGYITAQLYSKSKYF